ncbi:MAG: cob(I)yrinic acid a,c-diamide adenosyltransferase [Planctomycetes bacterium]|nr:cob(I)yrinic acid a,c-diamide adenosyltransferase [Planctomycetota bacterium]
MKLYTKQGDDGTTGLSGGVRVTKNDVRVCAYGDIDETNAAIGVAIAICEDHEVNHWLVRIQSDLFSIGAELAAPKASSRPDDIDDSSVAQMETWIDTADVEVSPLKSFILPGGAAPAASLHAARTVCRRAERAIVDLSQQQAVRREVIQYVNRLSDFLFAVARLVNHRLGIHEQTWPSSNE